MKAFVIYTLMRILLFVGAFGITVGIWAAVTDGSVQVIWALVIAFLVSGVASLFLLNPQRERFARVVQTKAEKASSKLKEANAKEDEE